MVCGVFHDLSTGQTDPAVARPVEAIGCPMIPEADTLVVSFVFNAEGACHLALGQPLPKNILDLSAEFKCQVNGKGIPRKNQGLIGALQYFGLSSIAPKRKDAMRDRIMKGWPFTPEERKQILDYCAEDVEALRQLLFASCFRTSICPLPCIAAKAVAALARSEHVGVPIDMEIFPQLADKTDLARHPRQHGAARGRARHLRPRQERLALEPRAASSNGLVSEGIQLAAQGGHRQARSCGARPSRAWPRPIRRSSRCGSCATSATSCARSS